MALRKNLIISGLATLAVLAATAAASAAPAVATGSVNVRSGPGTGYNVVDTLRRGQPVDVQQCRGSWCYVQKPGPDGWVSANYLAIGGGGGHWDDDWKPRPPRPQPPHWDSHPPHWNPQPPRPPHWNPRPPRPQPVYPVHPRDPNFNMCFNGPNGYFCMGT